MTRIEIEQGLAHLEHGFMKPQVWSEVAVTNLDTDETRPFDEWAELPERFAASEPSKMPWWCRLSAPPGYMPWWCQLSAPGYMDRTDTMGPFASEDEAAEALVETYADDICDCPEEECIAACAEPRS